MKYIHQEAIHNTTAANEIVPVLISIFKPESVADIGCGTGTFLKVFKSYGVTDVVGIDGSWVNRDLLSQNINVSEFHEFNIEEGFRLSKKYDLCICFEVAEHISTEKSKQLVQELCMTSDIVIFSAAIPLQGGQNHINEQWIEYWQKLFKDMNYILYDGLRQLFWNNNYIDVWYKQNIFCFIKNETKNELISYENIYVNEEVKTFIHPDLFLIKSKGYNEAYGGDLKSIVYLKLFIKSLFKKFGINI
ncbi:MAG: class I SAM-dependent methyltransferase [Chitinophagaceae bacterium]|jgi:SAM-dependent methyltransferase